MAEPPATPLPPAPTALPKPSLVWPATGLLLLIFVPIVLAVILYQPPDFDPAPLPGDHSFADSISVPERHGRVLGASERIGEGLLLGPEDLAYDAEGGYLYATCYDGWIRRVGLKEKELKVEDWAYVGGRPLGLALRPDGSLVVAESYKGLLLVKPYQKIELLTDEAEGLKFRLTDGIDVASNGLIYFTDASYKYNLEIYSLDILEGRPHGRLMSFNPSTNQTVVLARDLYFANGVALSPNQDSLIFCETPLRRCKRYYIQGDKRGTIESFIENLPGFPDNVRYDGEGHYWIALSSGRTLAWDILFKYPFIRKMFVILEKLVPLQNLIQDSGMLCVNLEGQPLAIYSDPNLILVTGGLKIENNLYYGSLLYPYVGKIDLTQYRSNVA